MSIFYSPDPICIKWYQKNLWGGSLECKNLLNFTWLSMTFLNWHHAILNCTIKAHININTILFFNFEHVNERINTPKYASTFSLLSLWAGFYIHSIQVKLYKKRLRKSRRNQINIYSSILVHKLTSSFTASKNYIYPVSFCTSDSVHSKTSSNSHRYITKYQ